MELTYKRHLHETLVSSVFVQLILSCFVIICLCDRYFHTLTTRFQKVGIIVRGSKLECIFYWVHLKFCSIYKGTPGMFMNQHRCMVIKKNQKKKWIDT